MEQNPQSKRAAAAKRKAALKFLRSMFAKLDRPKAFDPLLHQVLDQAILLNCLMMRKNYHSNAIDAVCMLMIAQGDYMKQRSKEYRERADVYLQNAKAQRQDWCDRQAALKELETLRRKYKNEDNN